MPSKPRGSNALNKEALSDSGLPLYLRLARHLMDLIESNHFGADGALPAERDLAAHFEVSRVTVRKALQVLGHKGLLDKRQGAGTFVRNNPRVEQKLSTLTSFSEDMVSRRLTAGSRWLDRSIGRATPEETLNLGISPGTTVSRLHRLRLADGVPMAIELSVLPARFLPEPGLVIGSLYEHLRQVGFVPHRALQRLKAARARHDEAKLLSLEEGAPILYIERRTMLEDGTPLEFVRSQYRGDIYDFVVELNLNP